jgi:hypothetical protein
MMFSSFTATGVVPVATDFATVITPVALVIVGASLAIGLTGWVISKMRKAAR